MFARARAGRLGPSAAGLARQQAAQRLLRLEHAAFALLLLSGTLLLEAQGWALSHARWLGLKVGLTAFLLLPLEGMHAFIAQAWIARGLRASTPGAPSRLLERGLGIEQMLRTLELLLFTPAVPLLVWLSLRKPV